MCSSCVHGNAFASEKDSAAFAMGSGVGASRCDRRDAVETVFAMGCVFFVTGCVFEEGSSFATDSAFGKDSVSRPSQARARSVARRLDPTLLAQAQRQEAPLPLPAAKRHWLENLAVPGPMRLRCPAWASSAEAPVLLGAVLRTDHLLPGLRPEEACRMH